MKKIVGLKTFVLCMVVLLTMAGLITNHAFAAEEPAHCPEGAYVNGICDGCGAYQPAEQNTDGYYEIDNAGKLYWFAALVNGGNTTANAVLTADITVNENVLVDGALNPDSAVVAAFRTWTPIGGESNPYTGTFDGQNYTISGLYYDANVYAYPIVQYIGLFSRIGTDALIKNVNLTDTYFCCYSHIGGIAAYSAGATVENCTVRVYLESYIEEGYMGGVVGTNENGTVTNCYNYGYVNGAANTGGVVGYNKNGTVEKCENHGTVDAYDTWQSGDAGGVVGYNDAGTVTNCCNTGGVWGNRHIGGVVGVNNYGTVSNCYNTGYARFDDWWGYIFSVGGVVGDNWGTVSNCYNTSAVAAFDSVYNSNGGDSCYVGGVVGCNEGTVTNCYNTGAVAGLDDSRCDIGGVLGYNVGTVTNCYNSGAVASGNTNSGGVVGDNGDSSDMTNCYYLDQVGDYSNPGGINGTDADGQAEAMTLEQFNSGEVTYLLGDAFGQTIGTDLYPVFRTENNEVLYGTLCPNKEGYANVLPQDPTQHTYENRTCIYCGLVYTIDLSEAVITVENVYYTGSEVTPAVVVTIGGQTLVEGVDYTVTYENNINIGTEAKVIITAVEGSAYTGTAEANFNILNCLTDFHALIEALEARLAALEEAWQGMTDVFDMFREELEEIKQNYATNEDLEAALLRAAALESKFSDLETRIAAAEEAIEKLKTDLETLQQALEALQEAYGTEIPVLQQALEALQNTVNDLDTVYATDAELAEALAPVNAALAALTQQIAELEDIYATIEEMEALREELNAAIEANSGDIAALTAALAEKYEELMARIGELPDGMSMREYVDNALAAAAEELAEAMEVIRQELEKAKEELQDVIEAGDTDLLAKIEALQKALDDAIAASEAANEALKTEIEEAKAALEETIAQIREELESAREELMEAINSGNADLKTALEKAKQALYAAIAANAAADSANQAELETLIQKTQALLQTAIDKVTVDLETARQELTTAIIAGDANLEDKIAALQTALDTAIAASNAADEALKRELNQAVTTLNAAIARVQRNLEDTKAALVSKDEQLNTMVVVAIAIAGVGMAGCAGLAAFIIIDKRKLIK